MYITYVYIIYIYIYDRSYIYIYISLLLLLLSLSLWLVVVVIVVGKLYYNIVWLCHIISYHIIVACIVLAGLRAKKDRQAHRLSGGLLSVRYNLPPLIRNPPYNLTSLGGHLMRGVIVGWVPPLTPSLNKMFLRSTTKSPPILRVLTKNHIYEAFRIDFVNTTMLVRSTTKAPICSIRERFDQKSFFMSWVIVPPSKLIVTSNFALQGGVSDEGGRSNQTLIFFYEGGNRASV